MTSIFKTPYGEMQQFLQTLHTAGITLEVVRKVNKTPAIAGDMMLGMRVNATSRSRKPSRFAQYKQHLNSLAEQKKLLVAFNAQAGDLAVSQVWLENLSTSSRHTQSLESLEVFVVMCGTLEKTLRYAQALMKFSQGQIWDSGFKADQKYMRLHARAFAYSEAGVYRVRVNLVDNWNPEKSRSVQDVYDLAAAKPDYLLTSVEGIFGYALQKRALIRLQDGTNLPYTDCPGIQQGDGFAQVVRFSRGSVGGGVYFRSFDAGISHAHCSGPSLLGAPRKVA